jgi:DNA-binding Lrp family transcriptional regulator
MDEHDHRLLTLLTQNARMPTAELARRVGLSRTTVQARIERLENAGAIKGYTLRLGDPARRELIRATVLMAVEPRATAAIVARLKGIEEVERLHTTSGRWDMIALVAARSTADLDAVLDQIGDIEGVKDSETLITLATKLDRRR